MAALPLVTIIIATFNAEKLLPQAIATIRRQTYPQSKLEILVVDGGSTDNTRMIARKHACIVLDNPKVAPAFAKHIGFLKAKGKYILYLDSDEVLENKDSIKRKVTTFLENQEVKSVISTGYVKPKGYPFICNYINEFGDPFSFFIYRISKDARFFLKGMKKRYPVVSDTKANSIFDLSKVTVLPIIELVAMATMIDGDYFKNSFPQLKKNEALIPHMFYFLNRDKKHIAIMKHDIVRHYSADSFKKYLGKIQSRIKNNIYNADSKAVEGFTGREAYLPPLYKLKKYLFVPYTLLVVPVTFDSFYLVFTRRDFRYLVHIPLCFYTAYFIVYHMLLRQFGVQQTLKSYGEGKAIPLQRR